MQHIIRETITLIRIERWLVHDDDAGEPAPSTAAEQVIEEIVLSGAEASLVRDIFWRILAERHGEERS